MPATTFDQSDDPALEYLRRRIEMVSGRLAAVVDGDADALESALDRDTSGLFELDDAIDGEGLSIPIRDLATSFGLSAIEIDVLLLAVAAEIDPTTRGLCARVEGGGTRPTVGAILASVGLPVDHRGIALVLGDDSPLVRHHLVSSDQPGQPAMLRPVSVPDRVVRAVIGVEGIDVVLRSIQAPLIGVAAPGVKEVGRAIDAGVRAIYIRESAAASGTAYAAAILDEIRLSAIGFDLRRAGPDHHPYGLAAAAAREGGLQDSAVVIGPIESLVTRDVESLTPLLDNPWPVLMVGSVAWEPAWSRIVPFCVDARRPDPRAVQALWSETFDDRGVEVDDDVEPVTSVLRLTPEQTVSAAVAAHLAAAADGGRVTAAHVRTGARGQSAGRLEQLSERIEPTTRFADLVLPAPQLDQVCQVVERGRFRDQVLDDWNMGGPGSRGRGITALFAGDSGTGKTLSAEAIAGELGVDLYVIDLSTVVDKYIGETEKNLGRVFDEAEGINGVLFFDEADALFGKRSDTSDAKDRYANVEVAYLLQRMERFDGVAILATNLRSNIDEAFTRRLDIIVHFTVPDVAHRLVLWSRHLPSTVPQSDDIDLELLASRFELTGGVIRNVALTAAYRAAQRSGEVTMGDLVRAVSSEYSKMGRLFDRSTVAPHAAELDRDE